MAAAFVLAAGTLWYWRGAQFALGFLIGSAVALANFLCLRQIVAAFVERLSGAGAIPSGFGLVLRFAMRYALIGLLAYGMLTIRPASLGGFLAGLFLPVAAFFGEAVYELYVALRRGL
jgi:hypothetical protein